MKDTFLSGRLSWRRIFSWVCMCGSESYLLMQRR